MVTEDGSVTLRTEDGADSDMKIVGEPVSPAADDGELAAREFAEQKANGNIERAYALGNRLAELLFTTDDMLRHNASEKYAENPAIQGNARVLFAFIVDIMLEHCCPGSVTARTALNDFHKRIEERSEQMYHDIIDSAAFSLYLLCTRDERMACACIGVAFADGCGMERDPAVASLGDRLYGVFYRLCADEIATAGFMR